MITDRKAIFFSVCSFNSNETSDDLSTFFTAYEILSDETKRRQYDARGRGGFGGGASNGSRARNFDFNFDDLFKQFEDDIFGDMGMNSHFKEHFGHHHHHAHAHARANAGGKERQRGEDFFHFEDLFQVRPIICFSETSPSQVC